MVAVAELNGDVIIVDPLASEYHVTIFPFPPLTIFSKLVKSKVAIPLPSSQSEVDVAVAVGKFSTVKSIATGSEAQFASPTTA